MTFLPIVDRELRVAARKPATYRSRLGVGALSIFVGIFAYASCRKMPASVVSHVLFMAISGPAVIASIFSGLAFGLDSLVEEKREGTLGLLFLTDLKGWDIILGKLAASSLNAFYSLFALVPILAVPLMIGGLSSGEVFRMALALIIIFLFSIACYTFAGAACRNHKTASSLGLGVLFLFLLFLPGIAAGLLIWTQRIPSLQQMPFPFLYTSPVFAYFLSLDVLYSAHAADFWFSIAVIHALTWLLIWAAARILPHSWQDSAAAVPKSVVATMLRRPVSRKELAKRAAHRKKLLDVNAFFWFAARNRFKPIAVWVALGIIVAAYVTGAVCVGRDWFIPPSLFIFALISNGLLKLWIASDAGVRIAEEKKSGAIELLLSTPLSVKDILAGQWLALRRQFLRPVIAVAAIQLVLVLVTAKHFDGEKTPLAVPFILAGLIMLVADMLALGWLAMYQAMFVRRPQDAGGQAVLCVLFVPWLIVFGIIIGINLVNIFINIGEMGPYTSLALWFVVGLLVDWFFIFMTRRGLLNSFRRLATTRYTERKIRFF